MYAALPGRRAHGIDFAATAVEAGAVAVLTDAAGAPRARRRTYPCWSSTAPRALLGRFAARVYGDPARVAADDRRHRHPGQDHDHPARRERRCSRPGVRAAVIGTVGTRVAGEDVKTALTTPEAPDLHGLFAMMRERGVAACAMEVSSHALVMGRVDGVVFDVAVFLNLGRDHLDFHADVEDYFQAKASLFTPERARLGLVNVDDEHGRRLLERGDDPGRARSRRRARDADWRAVDVELDGARARRSWSPARAAYAVDGRRARCRATSTWPTRWPRSPPAREVGLRPRARSPPHRRGRRRARPARAGRRRAGLRGRRRLRPQARRGRRRRSPTLRPLTDGRVIVVLGAGGDRDPGKRPIMGEIAARLADVARRHRRQPAHRGPGRDPGRDARRRRRRARPRWSRSATAGPRSARPSRRARAGDIVLVAGKGHETGQEVDGVVHPFDDRDVVREELARAR